ncbi:hypothetical protein [Immundisolibacter sp.]
MKTLEINFTSINLPTKEICVTWKPVDSELAIIAEHSFSFSENVTPSEIESYEINTARPALIRALNDYFEQEIYS